MDHRRAPASAVALLAGVCGAVQPKINAVLGGRLGSALVAALVNFAVAFVIALVAVSLRPATRRRLRGLRTWDVPSWTLAAGLGGVAVVVAGAVTVERIGVAVFSVAFFAGQITAGLLVDRLGLAPGGPRSITVPRVQAVVLAVIAVVLAQVGREAGELAPVLIVLVLGAGAAVSFQSAGNARITSVTGDPIAATALNVSVGTTALVSLVVIGAVSGQLEAVTWPAEPWLYLGGTLGVTVVLTMALATMALGALRATVTVLAAQIVAAFLIDWVVQDTGPTPGVVLGAVLIVAAVALVGRRPVPVAVPPVGEV